MTRSSKRQARRWVIQELTRSMEQRSQPLRHPSRSRTDHVAPAGSGDTRHHGPPDQGQGEGFCVEDGFDPDHEVTHAYGDDFTAQEWDSWWTSNPEIPFQEVVSPMWRLYRAHAFIELSQLQKVLDTTDNVVFFRRSNV